MEKNLELRKANTQSDFDWCWNIIHGQVERLCGTAPTDIEMNAHMKQFSQACGGQFNNQVALIRYVDDLEQKDFLDKWAAKNPGGNSLLRKGLEKVRNGISSVLKGIVKFRDDALDGSDL